MRKYFDTVIDPNGDVVRGASVSVTTSGGALVQLYRDAAGINPVTNPINTVSTDSLGLYSFFIPDGTYTFSYSYGSGPTVTVTDVTIGNSQGPNVVSAGSYLLGSGQAENPASVRAFAAAISAACAIGPTTVTASGTYRLQYDPTLGTPYGERYAVLLNNCPNITFDCAGATWLFVGADSTVYANMIGITNSKGVRGDLGRVDWLSLPYTQGVVASKTAATADITLDAGFSSTWPDVQRVELYSRDRTNLNQIVTKAPFPDANAAGWPVTYPSPGVMRINFAGDATGLTYLGTMSVGALYVLTHRVYGADALRVTSCQDVDLSLVVSAAAGMCERVTDCTDVAVNLDAHATGTRLLSATADGIHIRACRGTADIRGDIFNTGDDPLNVEVDSYSVTSFAAPRTFTISIDYPYFLPRVGDVLVGVADDGTRAALGKAVSVSGGGTVVMDTDLPGGFATTWQVTNMSAYPTTTVDLVVGYCRGHVRTQIPGVKMRVKGTNLWGAVTAEYIPSFTGEGIEPDYVTIDVDLDGCAAYASFGGAVIVQAYQLDNGGYMSAGAIKSPIIKAVIRNTRNSAIFIAGASDPAITLIADRASQNADTGNFASAANTLALVNCARPLLVSLANQGSSAGTTYKSGVTGLVSGSLVNFTA